MAVDEAVRSALSRGTRLSAVGWARWAWRQLTSMRTALLLLLLLAVGALPGSWFPQRSVDAAAVDAYLERNPELGPVLDRLGLFTVFTSPWFSAIYLLLFVSLVGCVVPRTRMHLHAIRSRPPRTPARLSRLPEYRVCEQSVPPAEVLEAAAMVLRRRRFRVDVRNGSVAAERGHLRETGNLLFHVALLGLLVAVAVGHAFGYRGEAIVVTGGRFANQLTQYNAFDPGVSVGADDLRPYSLRLDDLTARFEERPADPTQLGAPRDFTATLTVADSPDDESRTEVVRVNDPLDLGGDRIYLSGNGYAPLITVRDASGSVAFSGTVPFLPRDGVYTSTGVVKVPDAVPAQIGVAGTFLPTYADDEDGRPVSVFPDARDPRLALSVWTGDLGMDDGVAQSVYVLDTARMSPLRGADGDIARWLLAPGETATLPGGAGTVTLESVERFAAFTVQRDPGRGVALVSGLLALLGLVASLFVPRRRVWVTARTGPAGRTVVEVAGLARGDDAGLGREVDAVVAGVQGSRGPRGPRGPQSAGSQT